MAAIDVGRFYTSANYGVDWTERQPAGDINRCWRSARSDSDGSHLIIEVYGSRIYMSVDSGANWAEERPAGDLNKSWAGLDIDADGTNLIAAADMGRLYTGVGGEDPPADSHPSVWQLLLGGSWFDSGGLKHSDWCRFKRGTGE